MSPKGDKLIKMYTEMARTGYNCADGSFVSTDRVYNSFELRKYATYVKKILKNSKSILDYGCGGSNWYAPNFLPNYSKSAVDYFELDRAYMYEPARDIDERGLVDTVLCFDVLEHLYIEDVFLVLDEIFSYAKKSVILNIAGYEANALLPNGENAHTLIMPVVWWKGVLDMISVRYPQVYIHVLYSVDSTTAQSLKEWRALDWTNSEKFGVKV
jgi:hypothetical protein